MAWQTRHGDVYYYSSMRVGRRVRTRYYGTGEGAELIATMDQIRQLERLESKEKWQAAMARQDAVDAAVDHLCRAAKLVAQAALLEAGFHQHDRGEWRLKRVRKHPRRNDSEDCGASSEG